MRGEMIARTPLWLLSLAQMTGALVTFLLFLTTTATVTTLIAALFTFGVMALRTLRFTPAEGLLTRGAVPDLERVRGGATGRAASSPPPQKGRLG